MLKKALHFLSLLAILAVLSMVIRHFSIQHTEGAGSLSAQPLFASSLLNLQGKPQALNSYQGKVLVVNFWATWCPPCRDEMPELSEFLQDYAEKNVVVLGIAVDELDLVNTFLHSSPVSYPILIADENSPDLNRLLGNGQGILPYTVIINTDGMVTKTFFGRINKTLLEAAVQPLLYKSP